MKANVMLMNRMHSPRNRCSWEPIHWKIMYFPCKTASHLNMDPDNANLLFSLVSCKSTTFLSEQVQMVFSSIYMDQVWTLHNMYFPYKTASHLNMDPDNANLLFSLVSCISTTFLSEQVQITFSSKYMDQLRNR